MPDWPLFQRFKLRYYYTGFGFRQLPFMYINAYIYALYNATMEPILGPSAL